MEWIIAGGLLLLLLLPLSLLPPVSKAELFIVIAVISLIDAEIAKVKFNRWEPLADICT